MSNTVLNAKTNAPAIAGFSILSLALLLISGLLVKRQVEKTAQPIVQKINTLSNNISHQEWFGEMMRWLKDCPVQPTVHFHKPLDVTLK